VRMVRVRNFVAVPVLAGVFVTVLMMRDRESDTRFVAGQKAPTPVLTRAVEAAVKLAPTSRNGTSDASGATCKAGSDAQLGNPWHCVIHYPEGDREYKVFVAGNESYYGIGSAKTPGFIRGCCVKFGSLN